MRPSLRRFVAALTVFVSGTIASGQDPRPGVVHERLATRADPAQTYALYLPASYSAQRRFPTLFGFCPGGDGRSVVELHRAAAERFGWIVVASNNSRNGPIDVCERAGRAMWEDVHARFAIDDDRCYAAGTTAAHAALLCQQNAIASLIRPFNDLSPEVQAGYKAFGERTAAARHDLVAAAAGLLPAEPERALVALHGAHVLGKLDAKTLAAPRFAALRRLPGYRMLQDLLKHAGR